ITDETVYQYQPIRQVIENFRQIQVELRRIVISGDITVYQLKTQIASHIESIVAELQKLVAVVETDEQLAYYVKEVLVQYLVYLHNVYYQYQYKVHNIESRLQYVASKLAGQEYYSPLQQFLYKIGQVANAVQEDTDAGVAVYGVVLEEKPQELYQY
ncbi:hypothetical protein ILUMI_18630, partial [Ignelater luminosus]